MPYCPNCDVLVEMDSPACPKCGADFQSPTGWKPHARRSAERRGRQTFWGRAEYFEYDHDEYVGLIEEVSRVPMEPVAGFSLFAGLFAASLLAMYALGAWYAVFLLLVLIFAFPYYVVRLVMRWRMQRHHHRTLKNGGRPSYVPSDARGWASVYVVVCLATMFLVTRIAQLIER